MNLLEEYDLAAEAEAGATLQLQEPRIWYEDPDNAPLLENKGKPLEIDLLGLDGPSGKLASARMVKAMNKKMGQQQSIKNMTEEEILETASKNEDIQAVFYAELSMGWRNIETDKMLDFSRDEAAKLYKRLKWMRDQIDAFLKRRTNFKGAAKKS